MLAESFAYIFEFLVDGGDSLLVELDLSVCRSDIKIQFVDGCGVGVNLTVGCGQIVCKLGDFAVHFRELCLHITSESGDKTFHRADFSSDLLLKFSLKSGSFAVGVSLVVRLKLS